MLIAPLRFASRAIDVPPAPSSCAARQVSQYTPLTALRLGELALEAGVPPGVLNVLTGELAACWGTLALMAYDTALPALAPSRPCSASISPAPPPLPAGKGSECGDAITTHPLVDKVAFTGSTSVGKTIMAGEGGRQGRRVGGGR